MYFTSVAATDYEKISCELKTRVFARLTEEILITTIHEESEAVK
jgi:hypothetical protein